MRVRGSAGDGRVTAIGCNQLVDVGKRPDFRSAGVCKLTREHGGSFYIDVHKRRQLAAVLFRSKFVNVLRVNASDASESDHSYSKRFHHLLLRNFRPFR